MSILTYRLLVALGGQGHSPIRESKSHSRWKMERARTEQWDDDFSPHTLPATFMLKVHHMYRVPCYNFKHAIHAEYPVTSGNSFFWLNQTACTNTVSCMISVRGYIVRPETITADTAHHQNIPTVHAVADGHALLVWPQPINNVGLLKSFTASFHIPVDLPFH